MSIRMLVASCMILTLCASAEAQDWVKVNSGWPSDTVTTMILTRSNVLVGTQNGLFCSTNGGTTWSNITVSGSPGTSAGRINGLATDGTSVLVQADTNYFVSTNEGTGVWSQITVNTLPWADMYHTRRVKPTCFMVKGSRIIFGTPYYGATGADAAMHYTTDLGATWTVDGTGHFARDASPSGLLTVDNVPYIYLIVQNDGPTINNVQIARSTDDGVTWGYLPIPPQSTMTESTSPGRAMDGSRLYVTTAALWYQNLVSIAPGETAWTTLSSGLPPWTDLANPAAPGYAPIAARGGTLWACYRDTLMQSTDNGASWTDISSNLPATKKRIVVSDNAIYVGTYNGVYKKTRSTTGALSITLYKEFLGNLTGPTGKVSLYNDAWALVAQKNADEYSVALFPGLPTGTYAFDVKNTPATPWGEQYWGWRNHIVVSADATKFVSHSHNTPLVTAVRVYINATNELLPLSPTVPKDIPAGTVLRIEVDITNPDVIDAEGADSYAMVYLDRDRNAPYDVTLSNTSQGYTVGQSRTVSLLTTAASAGSYSLSAAAATVYSGGPLITDGSGWSGPVYTVTSSPPDPLAPPNGTTEVPVQAVLRWTRPAGVTSFHCQIATDTSFTSGVALNDTTGTDTVRTATGLSYARTYYWHVRGKTSGVYGPWSLHWSFRTKKTDPSIPVHIAPASMTTVLDTPVTVRWTRPSGATSFHLQLGTDSTFTTGLLLSDVPTTDTFHVVHALNYLTGYWWRVNAYSAATGISAYFTAWKFSIGMPRPGMVKLLSPVQNAVVNADTLRLLWRSATPRVDRYWLEYSIDSTFTIKAIDSLLTDTTTVLRSMTKNTAYYWHIRAHNPAGWGLFGLPGSFMRSTTGVDKLLQGVPGSWVLAQNYPNPFNPSTTITFGLPERARVRLTVYNTLGEMVSELTDAEWDAGYHSVAFNAAHLSSGVYFYRMDAGPFVMTRRLMLLR
jgi:hypothetical protein